MSFKDCMDRAVAGGMMDAERVAKAKRAFDLYAKDLPPDQAAARVVKEVGDVASSRRRALEANAKAQIIIDAKIEAGLPLRKIVEDHDRKGALQGRHNAVRAELRGEMNNVLTTFRANAVGQRRNKATLDGMVREAYEPTGQGAASELIRSFRAAVDKAADLYEKAGGFARYRGKKGLPQSHSQTRVNRATEDEWLSFVSNKIDDAELRNDLGERVLPAERDEALRAMYQHITGGGWQSRERSQVGGAYAVGERRLDPDYLPFKTGDDWLAYAEKFGEQPDPFRVMVGYIDSMSHQIAEAEVLGADPDGVWAHAVDKYLSHHKNSDKAKGQVVFASTMRDIWSGVAQEPQNRLWARGLSTTRQYLASFQLGSAVISSLSDFSTQRTASAFLGLKKTGHLKMLSKLVASKEFREGARELGLILENAVDMGSAAYRYSMEDFNNELAGRLSEFTMRSSGLSGLTQMHKDAFGMSVMHDIATKAKDRWSDLPVALQRTFNDFGIDAAGWDALRKAKPYEVGGVKFLRPVEIEEVAGREVAMGFMEFLSGQRSYAIIESSVQSRALVLGKTAPGSLSGEITRTVAQYKSFPIQFILSQFGRITNEALAGRKVNALSLAASGMIGMTLAGAVSLQLKEVSKGKKPRDMDTLEFWTAAAMQGGGLGIFGDFIFADQNRFGQGLGQTINGPVVGLADDLLKFTVGNAQEAIAGEDTNILGEAVALAGKNNPANSLWWARLAFEREIEDQLMSLVDPDAASKFQRKQRKADKAGNGFWWKPGESAVHAR